MVNCIFTPNQYGLQTTRTGITAKPSDGHQCEGDSKRGHRFELQATMELKDSPLCSGQAGPDSHKPIERT